jgi:hypothetical protein
MRDDGTGLLADGRAVIEMNMDAAREQHQQSNMQLGMGIWGS